MKDFKVIIPVHEYNDDVKELLQRAIESVPKEVGIVISCPSGLKDSIATERKVEFVENENGANNFATLVNQAVGGTKWFSILEFDDIYTEIWFDEVKKYIDFSPKTSVFMPLEDLYDFNNDKYIGFGNEAPWASSFSNELGHVDKECLENYFNFYLTGSIFNTDDWKEIGGLKPSIKLTFWYEFLLRATNKAKDVFVIPKVGYIHYLGRDTSLLENYRNEIDEEESNFWFNTAKEEYHFKEDRNKTYIKRKDTEE